MPAFLHLWLSAGRGTQHSEVYCPVKISNSISLVMCCALLSQLPLTFYYLPEDGPIQLTIQLISIIVCVTIPLLNQAFFTLQATLLLMLTFVFYICLTSIQLGLGSAAHYFLLLGIVISPFMLSNHPSRDYLLILILQGVLFLLLSTWQAQGTATNYAPARLLFNNALLMLCCGFCSYYIKYNLSHERDKIRLAKQQADDLLLNILPYAIAGRMMKQQDTIADFYPDVTVLFADIEHFTPLSRKISELSLVSLLNELYREMDQLFLSYRLEKIKTNGDGVMAVAGAPLACPDHAWRACEVALRLHQLFSQFTQRHGLSNRLRIGLHSGPAVGGVLGHHKFCYDIWGDTVNLAARMESSALAGKIHVSYATWQQCRQDFIFIPRGDIQIRGIGQVQTFWLQGHLHA